MAGSSDKTEKPTPRRIQQARENGQVAKSQDFNSAMVLGAATSIMLFMGGYLYTNFHTMMVGALSRLAEYGRVPMTVASLAAIIQSLVTSIFWILIPMLIAIVTIGIFSNLVQVRPLFALKAIQPKFDKINPLNGFKRLFSTRSLVEVGKAILKMTVIGGCGYAIIQANLPMLMGTISTTSVNTAWSSVLGVMGQIAWWSIACFFVLGVIDWRYQAWELEKQLRMSKQDIKDERKNQEGDPMIKSRIRQMGSQMVKKRQLAAVATADVIITNPTHFAVALKYDPDKAPAPMVVAKGLDHFALKIREVAKENGVPIVENKPLARSLHKLVEVDSMIAPELFVAVAEVLAVVFAKNKGRKIKRKKPVGGAS